MKIKQLFEYMNAEPRVGSYLDKDKKCLVDLRMIQCWKARKHFMPELARNWDRVNLVALKKIRDVCTGVSPWPLFAYGCVGGGKTSIGLLISDAFGAEVTTPSMWHAELLRAKDGTAQLSTGYRMSLVEFWRRWERPAVSVLDEIGTRGKISDPHYDTVQELVDRRHNRPAVYISNHPPEKIEQIYDKRIQSRMCCGTLLHLSSDGDRRMS